MGPLLAQPLPAAALAAALAGGASLRLDAGWALPAFWFMAGITVPLLASDLRHRRLPNRLTLPAYPVLLVLLVPVAVGHHDSDSLTRALLAAMCLVASYGVLHALNRAGFGAGDVKLAGVTGLILGWLSWDAVLTGTAITLGLGFVGGLVTLVRRGRRAPFAFGPAILVGAWAAMLA